MPASKAPIRAEVVVNYPITQDGVFAGWETLTLTEYQANYLAETLEFALDRVKRALDGVNGKSKDNPETYAE